MGRLPKGYCQALFAAMSALGALTVGAQTPAVGTDNRIVGLAFDSVQFLPLTGALVTIHELQRSVISDSAGGFVFDSVAAGSYTLAMMHEAVDAIGATAITTRVVVTEGEASATLAVPSGDTFWRSLCGGDRPAQQNGVLFGSIRDAVSMKPVPGATIVVESIEVGVHDERLASRQWRGETQSDQRGLYAFCGIPTGLEVRMAVASRDAVSPPLTLMGRSVASQDVYLNSAIEGNGAYGKVEGVVVTDKAVPIPDVVIRVEDVEVRTDSAGAFVLARVPLGTRPLVAMAIGAEPQNQLVHVTAGMPAHATIVMRRATILDAVNVTARSARQRRFDEIAERRALGLGRVMDSTSLVPFASIAHAVRDMVNPRSVCRIFIDGRATDAAELYARDRRDLAVIEALRGQLAPMQFRPNGNCIVLLVWTKVGMP